MTIVGLDHVQVIGPTGCEDDARRFYGDLIGLPEIPKPEGVRASGGAWFVAGDQQLHVGIEDGFTPGRKPHPAFAVRGDEVLDAFADRLTAAGLELEWDMRIEGVRRFYVRDPWGNRVELVAR